MAVMQRGRNGETVVKSKGQPTEAEEIWSLGAEIRALRKVKGMTLIEFSEKTGKSIGYLSQVERDITKPSHLMLQTISGALGVEIGWFYPADDQADPREQRYVVRKKSRRRLAYSDLGYTDYLGMRDYLLSPNLEGSQAMGLTTLEPGGSTGDDAYSHEGEEAGYVLEGIIELTIEGETFVLEAGDSYAFPSSLNHRFFNGGAKAASFIWCNTPVNIRPSFKSV